MNRKATLTLALAAVSAACTTASAQTPPTPINVAPSSTGAPPAVPAAGVPTGTIGLPAGTVLGQPTTIGQAQILSAAPAPGIAVAPSAFGMQPIATQGIPIPPGPVPQYFYPQPTVALTNTYTTGSPLVTQQTQVYTPTYYYYYYTPPQQASYVPAAAPAVAPVVPIGVYDLSGGMGGGQFGPMMNARGEAGHVRYPYYSYRRPWYFPGQPSFNVTIDGPVW